MTTNKYYFDANLERVTTTYPGWEPEYFNIFDTYKAIQLIKKHHIKNASVGIMSDMASTCDIVLENGEPNFNSYPFSHSYWGTPAIYDLDEKVMYPCFFRGERDDIDDDFWTVETVKMYYGI